MNLKGKQVINCVFGEGTVINQDETYITVEFISKTSKFVYPEAFERFLKAKDETVQTQIDSLLNRKKEIKMACAETEKNVMLENLNNIKKGKSQTMDELFSKDYHVEYLAKETILTYKEVEERYGIKISGFGRGINITPCAVILISSIAKSKGNFIYHDKWTDSGDYLYSGEGKTGNQSMTKGNLAIKNAAHDGKKIHLFVKFSPQVYYYQGVFELLNYKYEDEIDENSNLRKEYKFCLRRVYE